MDDSYSIDLRERALARKAAGQTSREIGAALDISPSCVFQLDQAGAASQDPTERGEVRFPGQQGPDRIKAAGMLIVAAPDLTTEGSVPGASGVILQAHAVHARLSQ